MMNTPTRLRRIACGVAAASVLLLASGCGEDPKAREKPKVSSARLDALQDNLAELSKSLDELKQESINLNSRIDAAQRQVSAVRARIATLTQRGPAGLDSRPESRPVDPGPVADLEPTKAAGDQAGKSFARNLLIAVFIVFVAVYGFSLWKKRRPPEETPADEPRGEADDSLAYTYPPPSTGVQPSEASSACDDEPGPGSASQ